MTERTTVYKDIVNRDVLTVLVAKPVRVILFEQITGLDGDYQKANFLGTVGTITEDAVRIWVQDVKYPAPLRVVIEVPLEQIQGVLVTEDRVEISVNGLLEYSLPDCTCRTMRTTPEGERYQFVSNLPEEKDNPAMFITEVY